MPSAAPAQITTSGALAAIHRDEIKTFSEITTSAQQSSTLATKKSAVDSSRRTSTSQEQLRQLQQTFLLEDINIVGVYSSSIGIPNGIPGGIPNGIENGMQGLQMHGISDMSNYLSMIATKIRKNVNINLCRSARPEVVFAIQLKPDGMLQGSPRLILSSGAASCNNAIERAILQSLPLPVPANLESFNAMRELHLRFRPHEDFIE
jgi:colicin import membrane protein